MSSFMYDTKIIENYLSGRLTAQEQDAIAATLLKDPHFQQTVEAQQQTYDAITYFGRRALKKELKRVEKRLFSRPDKITFQQKIKKIFGYEC
ncbi:hypothetical protein QQ020_13600 [Fulvivirgaceae bacterium BMA12]|uniref:Uncharacterized protein n=1 Tax=Agaribacillus aureus TaxID=3051825 RepID=A0ABT8L9M9_9BACT|nr:hypothetical protein [Fulvivirgaceae bacterium BMA12]